MPACAIHDHAHPSVPLPRLLSRTAASKRIAKAILFVLAIGLERLPLRMRNFDLAGRLLRWIWSVLPEDLRHKALWRGDPPRERWHSFDREPWRHPWLSAGNIGRFRAFNATFLERASRAAQRLPPHRPARYAFVGNIANNLYSRAVSLRKMGVAIDIFLHPHDRTLMSQPGWEEYEGTVPPGTATLQDLAGLGLSLPEVAGVRTFPPGDLVAVALQDIPRHYRLRNPLWRDPYFYLRYEPYFFYLPVLEALQHYDALLAVQAQYLAYLARRPYMVTQMGGDIWFECSRDDLLGRLQREAFSQANAFIVSNPWSLAFARRYGLRNLVYLPYLIDGERYAPGEPELRAQWESATGGKFFVLMTARLDWKAKGSRIPLEGFARFSRHAPEARLVLLGWGADQRHSEAFLADLGILDRVLVLPVSGKQRVIRYLRSAHCLLDQFVVGYFGATALEAFGCGVPVVMRLEQAQYDALLPGGAPPVCNAATPDQVVAWLLRLRNDSAFRETVARQARDWFVETHAAARWGGHYRNLLALTAAGHRFEFRASPLAEPLAPDEHRYNTEQFALAPVYPSYS